MQVQQLLNRLELIGAILDLFYKVFESDIYFRVYMEFEIFKIIIVQYFTLSFLGRVLIEFF